MTRPSLLVVAAAACAAAYSAVPIHPAANEVVSGTTFRAYYALAFHHGEAGQGERVGRLRLRLGSSGSLGASTRLLFQQQQQPQQPPPPPPPPSEPSEPWRLPQPQQRQRQQRGPRPAVVVRAAASSSSSSSSSPTPPKKKKKERRTKVPTGGGGKIVVGDSGLGDDGSGNNNDNANQRPEYDGTALARTVFAHPFFYDGDARMASVVAYKRAEFFSAETTVDDVRRQYAEKPGGLLALARAIKASDLRLRAYFAAVPATTEQVLDDLGIIPLNEPSEVATFQGRYIDRLPSMEEALREAGDDAPDTRSMALCFVTGSSGSGKTFFSLSALREFRNDPGNPLSCVLYLRAGILKVDYSDLGSAPKMIVREVQTLLNKYLARSRKGQVDFSRGEKLAMHVCLVLDECSAPRLGPFFEHVNMPAIQELLAVLESEVADSVTLVAAGTGTLGSTYDSKKEAYFFRMKQWGADDLRCVLEHFQAKRRNGKVTSDTLHLQAHETADTLANAINAHPWLAALTTNGRSTYFLCDTIAKLSQQLKVRKESWYVALGEWTPTLVEQVLHRYTSSNGLHDLEASAKATVATLVFGILDGATSAAVLPDVRGLDAWERRAVLLLLESNVVVADRKPRLLGGEARSVSVTPAVAVVLYSMVGITARTVAGWTAEEQRTVLFAARRWILDRLREYEATAAATDSQQRLELKWGFGTRLTKLRLVRLDRPVRSINGKNCIIPMVTKNHLLVNGDRASCADVIAPYTFLRCKYSVDSDNMILVDLANELNNCGILHGSDDRLLRGLFAIWQGTFDKSFRVVDSPGPLVDATGRIALQRSRAFPENLLKYREAFDAVQYASIAKSRSLVCGYVTYPLPIIPDNVLITFIVVTNVKAIKLSLPGHDEPIDVVASRSNVKGDTRINHPALTEFLKSEARVNVAVNISFTDIVEE